MSMNTLAVEAVAKAGGFPKPPSSDSALAGLSKYIPTESVTLYVAAVSAQSALAGLIPWLTATVTYWIFVVLTPIICFLLWARQVANAKKENKDFKVSLLSPKSWPWWKMIASTIAFLVWALAVPGNPIMPPGSEAGGVVAAFAAIFVSTILSLFEPPSDKKQT